MLKQICQNSLKETIDTALSLNWDDKMTYAMWSAQTYYFVMHSTRLFALAAARCPTTDNAFHFRFLKHLNDEKGHENLSINDLKILDFDLASLPELPATKSLYQTQYYWIEHKSPYAFFGYLLALEGLAVYVGQEIFAKVKKNFGEKATKFLKIHTEEDISHLDEVFEWINKMPKDVQTQVIENLNQTASNYNFILKGISDFKSAKRSIAA